MCRYGLQVALHYLGCEGVVAELTPSGDYRLGSTMLRRLPPTAGGYQTIDTPNYSCFK